MVTTLTTHLWANLVQQVRGLAWDHLVAELCQELHVYGQTGCVPFACAC